MKGLEARLSRGRSHTLHLPLYIRSMIFGRRRIARRNLTPQVAQINLPRSSIFTRRRPSASPRYRSVLPLGLLEARKADGVASTLHVFTKAMNEFDKQVSRACHLATKQSKIQRWPFDGDGFTLHSRRHTYITDLLVNGVDAPTGMEYSGHKSFQSFSVYLHKTDLGEKRACLILESVGRLLTTLRLTTNRTEETASGGPVHHPQIHRNAGRMRTAFWSA